MPPNNNSSVFDDDDDENPENDEHEEGFPDVDDDGDGTTLGVSSFDDTTNKNCCGKDLDDINTVTVSSSSDASEIGFADGATSPSSSSSEDNNDGDAPPGTPKRPARAHAAAAAIAIASTTAYSIERCRQKKLTKLPLVMGQLPPGSAMEGIYERLTKRDGGILNRPIVPSLFLGTRDGLASAAAYLSRGPSGSVESVVRFEETMISAFDGAEIHLDWEVPDRNQQQHDNSDRSIPGRLSRKESILSGKISHPTVLILHGINNSSDMGYIKSQQRIMTDRGWNAVAFNLRGCGGHKPTMNTPRSYTASYTGDIRSLVRQLVARMPTTDVPLFLVGNSLGALLITKYLGEEGLAGTLPPNVAGGISLGNPYRFRADRIPWLPGSVMGVGRKIDYFRQRKAMGTVTTATTNGIGGKVTLASLDRVLAPTMVRNSLHPPFQTKIGYGHARNGVVANDSGSVNRNNIGSIGQFSDSEMAAAADEYWADSGCFRQGRHVSVPLLQVDARDDQVCFPNARSLLSYSLQNPNVMVVQTRAGGHLGWWHQPPSSRWPAPRSWATDATADFIRAVLETRRTETKRTKPAAAPIDDAHYLFASDRVDGSDAATAGGTGTSVRPLHGDDHDDSSTIATADSYGRRGAAVATTARMTATTRSEVPTHPSRTYYQFRRVLVLQHERDNDHGFEFLDRNRHLERRESMELARRIRSRL